VRAEALALLVTMASDLFFNGWDLEVLPDCLVPYIQKYTRYYSQSFCLEAFWNLYVSRRCGAPEFYAVGLDGFEYRLINNDFVVGR
jgi:hypothetical protein